MKAQTRCRRLPSAWALAALTACGGAQPAATPPDVPALASAPQDFGGGGYVLDVLGMSCPKCISNIDLQLARIPGVGGVQIDMKHGTVALTVAPGARVTREALNDAVEDAGFTLGGIRAAVPPTPAVPPPAVPPPSVPPPSVPPPSVQ